MKYSQEIKEKIKIELLKIPRLSSKEIGNLLKIPSYIVRQYAVKNNLKFGHYTPFKSKDSIYINSILNEFIIGSLLGDGSMSKIKKENNRKNCNSKLCIKHSIKQKNYVLYKQELIKSYCKIYLTYPKINNEPHFIKNKLVISNQTICLETLQNKAFNKYREDWYYKGYKDIPNYITRLSPLAIAIWFMDDGTKCKKSGYYLCTDGFKIKTVNKLRNILYKQYGIISFLQILKRNNKQYPKIYISTKSINKFNSIISSFMCDSMTYKLHSVRIKQEELLETPTLERQKEDNQQPSLISNNFEGSTTNSRILSINFEDSNGNTSILPEIINFSEDIV